MATPHSSLAPMGSTWPIEIKDVDCLGVVAEVWESLGLTEVLDRAVPTDEQVKASSGRMLKALVLNVVGGRDPLYRVQTWGNQVPLEMLVDEGFSSEMLNDTSIGRHLDRLFEANGEHVFNTACLRVIEREGLSLERLHGDTTSRLVFGEYAASDGADGAISITRGHSKDLRPDLKQMMYGTTTTADGIPVLGQVLSGNTSDKKWHGGMLDLVKRLRPTQCVHYVGDSALVTTENLANAARHGIVLTARLPRTVGRCDAVVTHVLSSSSKLESLGTFSERKGAASYSGCVLRDEVLGHPVQLGVYRPDKLDERATTTVQRRQTRALTSARKAAATLMKKAFGCEHDGRGALETFKHEHRNELLRIDGDVVAESIPVKGPRGRPKSNAVKPSTQTQFRLRIQIEGDEDAARAAVDRENCFVVMHTGTEPITPRALLQQYKGQVVVEARFPFLKDPAWAEVFFLKTPARVEALGYVLLLALLVWSVWERRVRCNLERSGERPIRDTPGTLKAKPTAAVSRHILKGIKAVRVLTDEGWSRWQAAAPLNVEQQRIVRFSAPVPSDGSTTLDEGRSIALLPSPTT